MIKPEGLAAGDSRFQMHSFALQTDLSVGLASDQDLTFSDCFHAQSRDCVCISKNWPLFVVLILFRPMLLT